MESLTVLLLIVGGYCVLLFFDLFFKSCAHYPYLRLLDELGLKIGILSIQWKTKTLNRLLLKWGNSRIQFWKLWFTLGVFVSLAFFPLAFCLLFYSIFEAFSTTKPEEARLIIAPVIPGVNLPVSELGYYSLTLLICSVVHEAGHAIAAVLEDLCVLDLGCNLYFILPVAYVSIPTDRLMVLAAVRKLRVFCAGIWHNIFLSFMAYLLYCSLSIVFSPFYDTGQGISVATLEKNSPLSGSSRGLFVGDVVTHINNCKLNSENDWYSCLSSEKILKPAVCIESDVVNLLDESVPLKHIGSDFVECCDPKNTNNLCFEYLDVENNELELPGYVCLPGRTVLEKSTYFCTENPPHCPNNLYCFKPILPNNTYLFKIKCKTKNVIYLGHPNDLYQTVKVSSYIRKTNLFPVSFPDAATKLVKYIVLISLGLAFVNILPIMYMDGEYIFQVLGIILFKNKIGKKKTVLTITVITWMFSFLLVFYLIFSLIKIL